MPDCVSKPCLSKGMQYYYFSIADKTEKGKVELREMR